MRVAIVGGGISGLTTAFYLEQERRRGAPLHYVVYEAEPRFGGVILTERVEGCLVEGGPDCFLSSKPWARELCDDLRLTSQLIGSRDNQRKTYILVDGKLEPIPPGMQMMVPSRLRPVLTSRLFSARTKLRMLREYLAPPEPLAADDDESVASFVSRHFNLEVVDRLADPLLAGIYGGEASRLSARATLPGMLDMECRWRSLVRGALAARIRQESKPPQPLFMTFRDGMQRMVNAIVRHLPPESLRAGKGVQRIEQSNGSWRLTCPGGTEDFDQVVLSLPAHASATLMSTLPGGGRVAELLDEIAYSSATTLTMGYNLAAGALPPGFGFLVPRNEARRLIACTFVHNKFDDRAPQGTALLRVFMGGTRDPEAQQLSDSEITRIARGELREILGVTAEPQFVRVFRWSKAMPQYEVGHMLRVARIEMHMQRFSGLQLAGNGYHGVGIPDCVRLGRSAADAVMRRIRAQRVPTV